MNLRPLRLGECIDAALHLARQCFGPSTRRTAPYVVIAWFLICAFSVTAEPGALEWMPVFIGIPTSVPTLGMVVVMYTAAIAAFCTCITDAVNALRAVITSSRAAIPATHQLRRQLTWFGFYIGVEAVLISSLVVIARVFRDYPTWRATIEIAVIATALVLLVLTTIAVPVAMIESASFWASLRRSARLVTRRYFPVLAVLMLTYIMFAFVMYFSTMPIGLQIIGFTLPGAELSSLVPATVASLFALVALPVIPALTIVVYLDLRVRFEGLDLALAARAVGTERRIGLSP